MTRFVSKTYEERAWEAENKVEKLSKMLLACKEAMIFDMGNVRRCDWSYMIKGIEDGVTEIKNPSHC